MLEGNPISIDGIVIPSDDPVFLTIIAIHVSAGLACVISGIFAMLSRKGQRIHIKSGKIYFAFLKVVFITATLASIIRWKQDYHLFLIGAGSFVAAYIARKAVLKKWKKWSIIHIAGMALSYILLIIAFYVDNGRFIPFWKDLDPILYWVLPLVIGIPLTLWSLLTSPLSRNYFRSNRFNAE